MLPTVLRDFIKNVYILYKIEEGYYPLWWYTMSLLQSLLDELVAAPNGKVDLPLTHVCEIPVLVTFHRMGTVAPFRILTRIVNAEVHEGFMKANPFRLMLTLTHIPCWIFKDLNNLLRFLRRWNSQRNSTRFITGLFQLHTNLSSRERTIPTISLNVVFVLNRHSGN